MLIKRPVSKSFSVERPIFIVSAPCAGTGPIFELLSRARHVCTLNHTARNELRTRLESSSITAGEIRGLVGSLQGRWLSAIVANARQIPLLNEACPDALFIYVHRNAPEQLARMMLDGHSESAWAETTARIMNDLAAVPSRRWCAVDIDQFLSDRPHEAALLGRFAEISWRVRPGPAQKARRASVAKAIVLPEWVKEAAAFAEANHASLRDLPKESFWRANVAKAVVSSRLAAGLTFGAATIPVAANAATQTVTNNSDTGVSGDGSLRGEILAASAGDTIAFAAGLDGQTITLTGGAIKITVPLTIQGPGSAHLTIDGGGTAADGGGLTGGSAIFYLYAPSSGADAGPGTPTTVTISGLTLQHGNSPRFGGAIWNKSTNLSVSDVTMQDNQAATMGGGLFIHGPGTATVQDSVVTGNTSPLGGGVMLYDSGSVLLDGVQVTNNTATQNGGGIGVRDAENIVIESSTISGNIAQADAGVAYGGGLSEGESSSVEILGSTLSGNSATAGGGGLVLYDDSFVLIENSTLANNSAGNYGGGVALYHGSMILAETTISGNTSTGGGLYSGNRSTTLLTNSIVAGNVNTLDGGFPNDVLTTGTGTVQATYSLIRNPGAAAFVDSDGGLGDAGQVVGAGNIVGEDPLLGPLADNGGPTKTLLPATGSPVINAGDPSFGTGDAGIPIPTTDQRGLTRVVGGTIDMGAVEVQAPDAGSASTDGGSVETGDAGTTKTTGKGCNCNGSGDAAPALLTPIGLLLMRRRRRAT